MDPLPVPEAGGRTSAPADSLTLLAARAADVVPGFAGTDDNRRQLRTKCSRCHGRSSL